MSFLFCGALDTPSIVDKIISMSKKRSMNGNSVMPCSWSIAPLFSILLVLSIFSLPEIHCIGDTSVAPPCTVSWQGIYLFTLGPLAIVIVVVWFIALLVRLKKKNDLELKAYDTSLSEKEKKTVKAQLKKYRSENNSPLSLAILRTIIVLIVIETLVLLIGLLK